MSEPTLEEWFGIMLVNRAEAKKHLGKYDAHSEVYEDIAGDADKQIRSLCNRFRKLATHARRDKERSEEKEVTEL